MLNIKEFIKTIFLTYLNKMQNFKNWKTKALIILENCSKSGKLITYGNLAKEVNIPPPNTIKKLTSWLEDITIERTKLKKPLISALVVSKSDGKLPARGFFLFCKKIGIYNGKETGNEALRWHKNILNDFQSFRLEK